MGRKSAAAICTCVIFGASSALAAPTFTRLASFTTSDGRRPLASPTFDASGNLYGTTEAGGLTDGGTIFEVPSGTNTPTTLVSFTGPNGNIPTSSLITDAAGNLYGTTQLGGPNSMGTIFEITSGTHSLTTLAAFNNSNGSKPNGLIADASGNLYGTTRTGGSSGDGTVFELPAGSGTITTLANFNGSNGNQPYAGLVADTAGNLYGTTHLGGSIGDGTVFKVAAGTHTLSTLASFNISNGDMPTANLIIDTFGNLYGTTYYGGPGNFGVYGTVFEVAAGTNSINTLVSFNVSNGANPFAGLIADASGNLYGTTEGGTSETYGTVFKVDAITHILTTLYSFDNGLTDGQNPYGGVIADASGDLFGTAYQGGPGNRGTVFELSGTGFVVPEPGSLALCSVAIAAVLRRRRPARLPGKLKGLEGCRTATFLARLSPSSGSSKGDIDVYRPFFDLQFFSRPLNTRCDLETGEA